MAFIISKTTITIPINDKTGENLAVAQPMAALEDTY
jgi:hypothetical protein